MSTKTPTLTVINIVQFYVHITFFLYYKQPHPTFAHWDSELTVHQSKRNQSTKVKMRGYTTQYLP